MKNKWFSLFIAGCVNTIILGFATMFFYLFDDEVQSFGFGYSGLYVLLFAIPVLTLLNYYILEIVKLGENKIITFFKYLK
jgi:hypothetical protein